MNNKIVTILSSVFNLREDQIVPDLTREMVARWDSLTQMDLVTALEREFSIVMEIEDIVRLTSVRRIIETLQSKGVSLAD